MDPDAVRELYDPATATTYNERWHGEPWGNDTLHLADAIGRQVRGGICWLDVGCGTGHFLSRFPGVERAGIDISPSMLLEAREANPDALFFREADFRLDIPEFDGAWTLVTCTGEPWSYLNVISETEALVKRLASWTAADGLCLLAVQDVTDLTGLHLPYEIPGEPGFPGEILFKGIIWSIVDRSDPDNPRTHQDLVWPNLEHWIACFSRYFRTVVIETLPHDPSWLPTPRRVLLASDKRSSGDDEPTNVTYLPPLPLPGNDGSGVAVTDESGLTSSRAIEAPAVGLTNSSLGLESPNAGPVPLRDLTLGYIASRGRPWTARFWRSASRRVRQALSR